MFLIIISNYFYIFASQLKTNRIGDKEYEVFHRSCMV